MQHNTAVGGVTKSAANVSLETALRRRLDRATVTAHAGDHDDQVDRVLAVCSWAKGLSVLELDAGTERLFKAARR